MAHQNPVLSCKPLSQCFRPKDGEKGIVSDFHQRVFLLFAPSENILNCRWRSSPSSRTAPPSPCIAVVPWCASTPTLDPRSGTGTVMLAPNTLIFAAAHPCRTLSGSVVSFSASNGNGAPHYILLGVGRPVMLAQTCCLGLRQG